LSLIGFFGADEKGKVKKNLKNQECNTTV
jgi:hypothetical protein